MQRIAAFFIACSYLVLGTYAVPAMRLTVGGVDVLYAAPFLAIAALLAMAETGPQMVIRNVRVTAGIGLYLLGSLIASIISPTNAPLDLLKAMVFPFTLLAVNGSVQTRRSLAWSLAALAVTGIGVFCYGAYGYITWNVGEYIEHTYNYFGVTYKPSTRNGDQLYFMVAGAIITGFVLTPIKSRLRVIRFPALFTLACLITGVVLSYSRGAWVTILFTAIAAAWVADRAHKGLVRRVLVGAAAAVVIAVGSLYFVRLVGTENVRLQAVIARFESIYTLESGEGSNTNLHRLALLKQGIELIVRNPLGIGIGNSGSVLVVDGANYGNHAENSYVQVFLERGFLGFAGFLLLVLYPLLRTWRAARQINAGFIERASFLVCVVLFFYGFFNNLIDSAWYWMALAAVTTSLVVSPLQSRMNPRFRRFPPPRPVGNEMPQGQR